MALVINAHRFLGIIPGSPVPPAVPGRALMGCPVAGHSSRAPMMPASGLRTRTPRSVGVPGSAAGAPGVHWTWAAAISAHMEVQTSWF